MRTFTYLLALTLYLAGGLAASAQDSSLPFTVSDAPTSDGWAENTTWYFISNGKGNYLSSDNTRTADDANILQFAASGGGSTVSFSGYPFSGTGLLWCFVGDNENGFKVYNKKSGSAKLLGMTLDTSVSDPNTMAQMVDETSASSFATLFTCVSTTYGTSGYWCVKQQGTEKRYLTQNGAGGYTNALTFWTDQQAVWGWGKTESTATGDAGSSFKFEQAFDYSKGYYQIVNNSDSKTNKTISSEDIELGSDGTLAAETQIHRFATVSNLTASLWHFDLTSDSTGYSVVNANTGLPMGKLADTNGEGLAMVTSADSEDKGAFKIVKSSASGVYGLSCGGRYLNPWDSGNALGNWGSSATGDNLWKIVAVTEIPVTVTSVGWASVCMPFAVKLSDGTTAKAYKGTAAANGRLQLAEITGVLPAKTGFLIALSGGGTVNLTICDGSGAELSGNVLSGATAKRTGFTGGANYFLAADGTKAVLMQADDSFTVVPANKAYLEGSKVESTGAGSSKMLSFSYGEDGTSGVSAAAQSESERAVRYYDLSGRRVLYPANGIFVTDKGEKVLLH